LHYIIALSILKQIYHSNVPKLTIDMNHTTLERIVAISLVAAMTTIGMSALSSAKVMAQPIVPPGQINKLLTANCPNEPGLDNGAISIKCLGNSGKIRIEGPLGRIEQDRSVIPDLFGSILSGIGADNCPGNSGNPGQGCENGNAGGSSGTGTGSG
jgi:hypothetical protein